MIDKEIRIIFFIGSLTIGGKERRLLELMSYLKTRHHHYSLLLVINHDYIYYTLFKKLNIPYKVLHKKNNHKDPRLFFDFYKICKEFKPHVIHTWGRMQTFYAIPSSLLKQVPIINSQITDVFSKKKFTFLNLINQVNFKFSRLIVSNSIAGLHAYKPPVKKSRVIYNGVNLDRFVNLPSVQIIKNKFGIRTRYAVVMVASFSRNKDFDLFYKLARYVTNIRSDISFIGAGGPKKDDSEFQRLKELAQGKQNIIFPGQITEVEALVNACDIGVLFSPNGEGLSNAIIEYMALGKPVIANDAGGTKELVGHGINGFLVDNETPEELGEKIIALIDDPGKRNAFGNRGRDVISKNFTLQKMGESFNELYCGLIH